MDGWVDGWVLYMSADVGFGWVVGGPGLNHMRLPLFFLLESRITLNLDSLGLRSVKSTFVVQLACILFVSITYFNHVAFFKIRFGPADNVGFAGGAGLGSASSFGDCFLLLYFFRRQCATAGN